MHLKLKKKTKNIFGYNNNNNKKTLWEILYGLTIHNLYLYLFRTHLFFLNNIIFAYNVYFTYICRLEEDTGLQSVRHLTAPSY